MPAPIGGAGGAVLTPGISPVLGGPGPGGPKVLGIGGPGGMLRGPAGPGYLPSIWPIQPPYLPLGPLPCILTPGIGPNGIGPIDSRRPVYSVGEASTVPYGTTRGYAAKDTGVTGFIGPAAGSLRRPKTWYVRSGGLATNGGDTTALTPEQSGNDGVITNSASVIYGGGSNGSATFSSATAVFTSAHVGRGILLSGRSNRISAVTNSTTVTVISDGNIGNNAGVSWAVGGAWASLANAYTLPSAVFSGDTIYMGAGTYRATLTVAATPNFNGVVSIIGDVTGQFTGDAGMVQLTAYTTNDKTAPSGATLLNLNGKSNLTFQNIMLMGGSGQIVAAATATSQNIAWRDCAFLVGFNSGGAIMGATNAFGIPFAWTIDRCLVVGGMASQNQIVLTIASGTTGGDYDTNFVVSNTSLMGGPRAIISTGGVNTFLGGGVIARNCTFTMSNVSAFVTSNTSAVFPCKVIGCFLYATGSSGALSAGVLGQIIEDYNLISTTTPRTSVTAGAHSISDGSYAPLFHFGQERFWLPPLFRPFGEPMAGSPLLGFGSDGGQTLYDLRGPFNIRPAGGSSALPAAGALERADTFVTDPTPIGNNTTPIKLTGPGYNDFLLPIGLSEINQARTISVAVQWDANYSSPVGLPAIQMEAKPQMGVSQQTVAATGNSATPHTITLASFTPTAAGVLNIRLLSFDQTGTSVVEWDSFTVT